MMDGGHGVMHNIIHKDDNKQNENNGLKPPSPRFNLIPNIPIAPPLPNLIPNLPVLNIKDIIEALFWAPITQLLQFIQEKYDVVNIFKNVFKFIAARPYLWVPLFILGLTLFTPVLAFVFFAFVTVFLTFSGFLLTEGTVLLLGTLIFGSYLIPAFIFAVVVCTVFGTIYFCLQKIHIIK